MPGGNTVSVTAPVPEGSFTRIQITPRQPTVKTPATNDDAHNNAAPSRDDEPTTTVMKTRTTISSDDEHDGRWQPEVGGSNIYHSYICSLGIRHY